ncbi:MAG: PorP/SprF family type IX secretion system membrane protein [Bacteroidota bacterium]
MRKIYIIFCLSVLTFSLKAQDIHFSQLSQTPLLINPASAGVFDGYYRALLNYKNQWAAIGKPYQTFMGSFDMPFEGKRKHKKAYLGLGTYLFSDKAGDSRFSTTEGNVIVSGIVPLGMYHKLSAGISAGVTYRKVDIAAIQWPNQYNGSAYDPTLPSGESNHLGTFFYFDMAAGVHYQYLKSLGRFYGRDVVHVTAGAAVYHAVKLLKSAASNKEKVYPRYVFHSTLRYDLKGTKMGLIPSVLYMKQGPAYELDLGLLMRFRLGNETNYTGFFTESAFTAGVIYRHKDAIIPQVFFEVSNFGIGLSYDVNISSFATATKYNGGLEVSIRYSKFRGALYKNWR